MLLEGVTPILPTEDRGSVLRCIFNLFPDCDHSISGNLITFSTSDLEKFMDTLTEQQIRDTASMVLEKGLVDDTTQFYLNKQAAYMGRINFTDGDSNLGDLNVTIKEGAREFIQMITPSVD
jgi:predicted RNA binding protein with dsRBD fold (UPF0201 family)